MGMIWISGLPAKKVSDRKHTFHMLTHNLGIFDSFNKLGQSL